MSTITEKDVDIDIDELLSSQLILWNDDINSFQHVIACLIEILDHHPEQAEQCAILVHTKGKCTVKNGSLLELKPFKDLLVEMGLSVTIE